MNEISVKTKHFLSLKVNENEILKKLSYLIAYSQNANSEIVEQVLKSDNFDPGFLNFNINEMVKL